MKIAPPARAIISLAALALLGAAPGSAAKIETCTIKSASMAKTINVTVVTPDSYKRGAPPYPVIYLLHGFQEDHTAWVKKMPITASLADRYNVILVCPDGGYSSWYWDSPTDPACRYETHLIGEVIPFIDQNYATISDRKGRAISGFSMGGHGALYLAFRHQDLFAAAGSMAGAVDIRPFAELADLPKRFGDYASQPEMWDAVTVINLTHLLKKDSLALIIDCGTDDFLAGTNRKFHEKLLSLNIPHDYIERPGAHELPYWNVAVEYQVLFFRKYFDRAADTAPAGK